MDEVSTKLTTIFHNVNDWLKFAETKNAVLLAFAGAGITATVTFLSTAQKIPNSLRLGLLVTTSLLCICALICSLSFLPKTDLERLLWTKTKPLNRIQQKDTDNFYFFGHLQKYHSTELLDALNKYYFEGKVNTPYKKEYQDIASQITINAEITSIKFKFFTYALYTLVACILVLPCSVVINLVVHRSF